MNTKTAEPTNGTQLKWKPVTTARDLKQVETRTEVCDKHGEFLSLRFLNIWSICDQCIEEANHQHEAAETARRLANRVAAANIPPRFSGKTLDAYITETNDQKLALETARAYVNGFPVNRKVGRCLVFLGGVGTGKTLLACGIADALARAGYKPRYTTVSESIRTIRETWRPNSSRSDADVLREYARYDLLILDEVGVQIGSEAELTQLTDLLDLRYRELKPTLVISNCDPAGLEQFLGPRAVDRLRENDGIMVACDWKSWRGRKP